MNRNKKSLHQLDIIKRKFISYEPNAKDYSFEELPLAHCMEIRFSSKLIRSDSYIEITLPILDSHNDYIQLYAQASVGLIFLTDDGFFNNELSEIGFPHFVSAPICMTCKFDEFEEKIGKYEYIISCAMNLIECKNK